MAQTENAGMGNDKFKITKGKGPDEGDAKRKTIASATSGTMQGKVSPNASTKAGKKGD